MSENPPKPHEEIVCVCGNVLLQCRCPGPHKKVMRPLPCICEKPKTWCEDHKQASPCTECGKAAPLWMAQVVREQVEKAVAAYKAERDQAVSDGEGWAAKCRLVEAELTRYEREECTCLPPPGGSGHPCVVCRLHTAEAALKRVRAETARVLADREHLIKEVLAAGVAFLDRVMAIESSSHGSISESQ